MALVVGYVVGYLASFGYHKAVDAMARSLYNSILAFLAILVVIERVEIRKYSSGPFGWSSKRIGAKEKEEKEEVANGDRRAES